MKKICICGTHGTGKTSIVKQILFNYNLLYSKKKIRLIPEIYREMIKYTEFKEIQNKLITLATYSQQLCLEQIAEIQNENIICDRSILDCFVYYNYYNGIIYKNGKDFNFIDLMFDYILKEYINTYNKIYLIEPSNRPIYDDGFRLIDKESQREIHNLFLEYLKNFKNVVIVNQEDQDKIIEMAINDFII